MIEPEGIPEPSGPPITPFPTSPKIPADKPEDDGEPEEGDETLA